MGPPCCSEALFGGAERRFKNLKSQSKGSKGKKKARKPTDEDHRLFVEVDHFLEQVYQERHSAGAREAGRARQGGGLK